jgi:peptidoglycan/LPS O-acetylase OafA/YrhL
MKKSAVVSVRRIPWTFRGHAAPLDGIRAIAVMVVIGSHLASLLRFQQPTPWTSLNRLLQGGFVGVDIFFVLSGFLITSLILNEIDENGSFSVRRFYARRALRLLPALYVLLAVVFVISVTDGFSVHAQWTATWAAFLYIINWVYALPSLHQGIEELPSNLGHLWSLAVEEQFYLVWPLVMYAISRRRKTSWLIPMLALTLIALVVSRRYSLLDQGYSTWSIFPRTDARIDSILMGVVFAFAHRHLVFHPMFLRVSAYTASGALIWFMYAGPNNGLLFKFGFTIIALCSAIVVIASVDRVWWPSKLLASRPLTAIGKVSYGLYLWHIPVFVFMSQHVTGGMRSFRILLALLATSIVTLASWKMIEAPSLRFKDRRYSSRKLTADQSIQG